MKKPSKVIPGDPCGVRRGLDPLVDHQVGHHVPRPQQPAAVTLAEAAQRVFVRLPQQLDPQPAHQVGQLRLVHAEEAVCVAGCEAEIRNPD